MVDNYVLMHKTWYNEIVDSMLPKQHLSVDVKRAQFIAFSC